VGARIVALAIGSVIAGIVAYAVTSARRANPPVDWTAGRDASRAYAGSALAREIESGSSAADWTGMYFRGNGFEGEHLAIAPSSGYARWRYWDAGPPFESPLEQGRVVAAGESLQLVPSPTADGVTKPVVFHAVRWGPRRYLLAESEADAFCRATESGEEPRTRPFGKWLLRVGDEGRVPAEGERMLPDGVCR
jgi:hypothetical protein